MMTLIIGVHVVACLLLVLIVLIQQGRGGGLVEGFSGVENMFGPKTSVFLTRATTVLSILFFTTCLSLAVFSAHRSRSLMKNVAPEKAAAATAPVEAAQQGAVPQVPVQTAPPEAPPAAATAPAEQAPASQAPQQAN